MKKLTILIIISACCDAISQNNYIKFDKNCSDFMDIRCEIPLIDAIPLEHKCCDVNQNYNPKLRICEFNNKETNSTTVHYGIPNCSFVEVDLIATKMQRINNGIIKLFDNRTKTVQEIDINNSCFDSVDDDDNYIFIKTCRGLDVCNEIYCLRKCCPNGQSYFKTLERKESFCKEAENFEYRPEFYMSQEDKTEGMKF